MVTVTMADSNNLTKRKKRERKKERKKKKKTLVPFTFYLAFLKLKIAL